MSLSGPLYSCNPLLWWEASDRMAHCWNAYTLITYITNQLLKILQRATWPSGYGARWGCRPRKGFPLTSVIVSGLTEINSFNRDYLWVKPREVCL